MANVPSPTANSQPSAQGTPIKLGDLVQGAQDNAKKILEQYNSNPALQAAGISYIADPANPGRFIQIQGQTPVQQQTSALGIAKSQEALSTNTGLDYQSALQEAIKSGNYSATGETGKKTREALIANLSSGYSSVLDPTQIAADVYNGIPDKTGKTVTANDIKQKQTQEADTAKANSDGLVSALSSLDTAQQQLIDAGGAKGPIGGLAKIPLLGQYLNPKGYTYEKTKTDIASQLARAVTGSARSSGSVYEGFLDSLPDVTDNPEVAKQKLTNIYQQMIGRAKALGLDDIVSQYSDILGQNTQGQQAQPQQPSSPGSSSVGKYQVEVLP